MLPFSKEDLDNGKMNNEAMFTQPRQGQMQSLFTRQSRASLGNISSSNQMSDDGF